MSLKDSWKQTGKGLGHAFRDLGRTIGDTVNDEAKREQWKETGRGLGHAFRDFGKTAIRTAAVATEKLDDIVNGEEE